MNASFHLPTDHLWRGWTFPYLCLHFLFPACHYVIQEAQIHFAKARSQKLKGYSGCCSKLAVCQQEDSSPIPIHT